MMTGSNNGLEKVRKKVDSLPYEKFPFCCGRDDTIKVDYDMTQKPVKVIQPITMVREPEAPWDCQQVEVKKYRAVSKVKTPPKPKVFWTPELVGYCLSLQSQFQYQNVGSFRISGM